MKIRNSLAYSVLGMILLTALSAAAVIAIFQHQSFQDMLLRAEADKITAIERAVKSHVRRESLRLQRLSRALADNRNLIRELTRYLDTGDVTPLSRATASVRADMSLDLLQFGDPKSLVVHRATASQEGIHESLTLDALDFDNRNTHIRTAAFSRGWTLLAITAIRDQERPRRAVVTGILLDDAFAISLAKGTDMQISLFSHTGQIARSLPPERTTAVDPAQAQALFTMETMVPRSVRTDDRLIRYTPLPLGETTFVLALELDTSASTLAIKANHNRIIRSMAVVFLVALTLGALFSTYLILPLARLRNRVANTARELSDTATEPESGHEITGLVRAFDVLTEVLRSHVDHTEFQQEDLERKVRERTAELEHALQAKSEFLARVSHEVRTPLHGVIGLAEMGFETAKTQKQKQYHQSILQEAGALLEVINDILEFSKIEAGKASMRPMAFDLFHLVEDLSASTALRATRKGLDFHSFVSPDVPLRLVGPPGRIRQVLANLISNALKFTHEGEISVQVDLLSTHRDHVVLRFEVRDTGIGIPENQQEAIFDSFTQADGSDTRQYGGTGLGTTIARHLVALMGGEIGVQSEAGKGSLFWFTIKLGTYLAPWLEGHRDDVPPKDRETTREDTPRRLRILLVEDYLTNQMVATKHLTKAGHEVHLAEDGAQSVVLFKRTPFDLVLMDIQMPVMDGYEATQAIRELERTRAELIGQPMQRTPIVALTAHAAEEAWRKCEEAGMDGYLVKPIKRIALLAEVEKWAGTPVSGGICEPEPDVPSPDPMDYPRALLEFEGDEPFLHEALAGFLQHVAAQLESMPTLLDVRDFTMALREAHSIKGGAANLTAHPLAVAALGLQRACEAEDDDRAQTAFRDLTEEFSRFKKFAEGLLEGNVADSGR